MNEAGKMSMMERPDAAFDDAAFRTLALSERQKITALAERLFGEFIDIVRPSVIAEAGAFAADFSRNMHAKYQDARICAFEANPRVLLGAGISTRRCALWIDVEGAVDQVLEGAAKTLAQTDLVICELESSQVWNGQVLGADIGRRLGGLGFSMVARDCQKWFQYNAIFVRTSVLQSNARIQERVNTCAAEALSIWNRFSPSS